MKKIILIAMCLIIISCKENIKESVTNTQNIKKMNNLKNAPYNISELENNIKYNYDTLSLDYINKVKTSLTNKNFKFLEKKQFDDKILDVFSFNINNYKNNIIVLRPALFTEIVIKDQQFVLIEDSETDNGDDINSELEYYYNSYVFHNDKISFNWLKNNEKEVLKDLVVEYGYNKDKELMKFIFKEFDFDNNISFHNLIFSKELISGKFKLRLEILNDIENIVYGGIVEGYTDVKEGNGYNSLPEIVETIRKHPNLYLEPEKSIAFLYEKDLRIGVVGHIESNLKSDTGYKSLLKSQNYFNNSRLKGYVENVFGDNTTLSNIISAKINDSDGFTNLRQEKNTSSAILEKVKTGSEIEVLDKTGDWWLVVTKAGNKGYIFKTKIVSE